MVKYRMAEVRTTVVEDSYMESYSEMVTKRVNLPTTKSQHGHFFILNL